MIDIQLIRKDPNAIKEAIATLGTEAPIDQIVDLDRTRRVILQELESLRQDRNQTSEKIGRMEAGDERQALIDSMGGVNERIKEAPSSGCNFIFSISPSSSWPSLNTSSFESFVLPQS